MTLSQTSYGIHGTNLEWSIGRIATHGCIRLYTDDIHRLYDRTAADTPVHVVYQPVKLGRRGEDLYLDVHPDLYERHTVSTQRLRVELVVRSALGELEAASIDPAQVEQIMAQALGVPMKIGRLARPQAR